MLDKPAYIAGADRSGAPRAPAPEPPRPPARDGFHAYIAAFRQRYRIFIATVVLIPLCGWLVLLRVTPLYTATGALIYEPAGYRLHDLRSIVRQGRTTPGIMSSQAQILQSLHIAERVAERGHLFANPEFNATLRPPGFLHRAARFVRQAIGLHKAPQAAIPAEGPSLDQAREQTLLAVQSHLHASPVDDSHVIQVRFVARDPVVAATAVNNAMDVYIKAQYAAKYHLVDRATALLKARARQLRGQVRRLEFEAANYRVAHAISQGVHASTDVEEVTHLTEDLARAQAEEAAATARLDAASGMAGAEAQAAVAPSVTPLRTRVATLTGQLQALRTSLGSAHPYVIGLTHQLAAAREALTAEVARVVAATKADQRAAAQRVATLRHILKGAKTAALDSDKTQIPLKAMQRDLDAARGQLQSVLDQIEQTAQQADIESAEAHEISEAIPPASPSSPRTVPLMAASAVAAIFLGLVLIHVLQLNDTTLHSGEELRVATALPCLALIPEASRRALGPLNVQDYIVRRPLTAFAEQIRSLRAGLSLDIEHPQIVAITAARPAEGKSLLALTLARSAQTGGERVLAIECDVRRASFQQRLGGMASPGLLEVLRGEAEWHEVVQEDSLTGMKYLAAGRPGGDILALFLSDEMRQLLADVRDHFDLILLDAPPVEAMTEARVAAALADATLMCVRWRSTPARTLLHAMEILHEAHAHTIGTVLTRVDPHAHLRSGSADAAVYHRRYHTYFRG